MSHYEIMKNYPDNSILLYYFVDIGYTITKRDFLERKINVKDFPCKGDLSLLSFSVKDNLYPEKEGFLRGITYMSGTIIK